MTDKPATESFDGGYLLESRAIEQSIRQDERQKVLAEVESWLVDEKQVIGKTMNDFKYPDARIRNGLRAKLRAKLVEMKGEGK